MLCILSNRKVKREKQSWRIVSKMTSRDWDAARNNNYVHIIANGSEQKEKKGGT